MNSLSDKRQLYSYLLRSIPFWVIVYFLFRLIGITQPPAEVSHNWRQTTVCMVARNFLEVDANILFPRIDMAGTKSGITGMEFPLLNYLIYLLSTVFGYAHWYGRLINLIITSVGILFFGKLVKEFTSPQTALFSVIVLLNSSWLIFGRKIMPDTFSLSLMLIGVYYGYRYLTLGGLKHLLFYCLLLIAGCLAKLPSIIIVAFLTPSLLQKPIYSKKKIVLITASIFSLLPVIWWYFIWTPYLVKTYEFWHFFMGMSVSEGLNQVLTNFDRVFFHFYFSALKWVGFGLYACGLVIITLKKDFRVLTVFGASSILLIALMSKSGFVFYIHDYYILPFVPIMALMAGITMNTISKKTWQIALILLLMADGIGNQYHDWRIKDTYRYKLKLEEYSNRISNQNDLIAINSGENPSDMYFAHRKGWMVSANFYDHKGNIDSLVAMGCKHFFITRNTNRDFEKLTCFKEVLSEKDVRIYSLIEDE